MEADIVSIGNSRGIRIPAHILKLCGIEKKVQMEVRDGQITLTPVKEVRQGWEDAFRQAASRMADAISSSPRPPLMAMRPPKTK